MNIFNSNAWITFIITFALFAKSLWFYYYFSLYGFKPTNYPLFKGTTALIVPTYNEEIDKLEDTVHHAMKCKGLNEIIFVNDGSTDKQVPETLARLEKEYGYQFKFINLEQNVGKRRAQREGLKHVSKHIEVIVFMDSDTILKEDSIIELTKPMSDEEVGGTTACIHVRNKNDNLLTKAVSSMYWTASHIWRKAPAKLGFVQVTNGQLSCYKANIIRDIMPTYTNQEFMGVICTLSDDRYITHHIQTDYNKRIEYSPTAIVETYIPTTFKAMYKMFLRWKRGSWRESTLVLKRAKQKPILVTDIWANHSIQLMQTIIRIAVITMAIIYSPLMIAYYLIVMIIISLLFSYDMIWKNPQEVPFRIIYTIMNEFYFSWTHIHGLIQIKKQGTWSTR